MVPLSVNSGQSVSLASGGLLEWPPCTRRSQFKNFFLQLPEAVCERARMPPTGLAGNCLKIRKMLVKQDTSIWKAYRHSHSQAILMATRIISKPKYARVDSGLS